MSTITTINSTDLLETTSRVAINNNFANLNTDKYQSGDSPVFANVIASGHSAFGADAVINKWGAYDSNVVLIAEENITGFTNPVRGISSKLNLNSGADTAQSVYALEGFIDVISGAGVDYTGKLVGVYGRIFWDVAADLGDGFGGRREIEIGAGTTTASAGGLDEMRIGASGTATLARATWSYFTSAGTLTTGYGHLNQLYITAGTATTLYGTRTQLTVSAGALTSWYGHKIDAPSVAGSITTDCYGLVIGDHSYGIGATTTANILSEGTTSKNIFQGKVVIGTTTTTNAYQLYVDSTLDYAIVGTILGDAVTAIKGEATASVVNAQPVGVLGIAVHNGKAGVDARAIYGIATSTIVATVPTIAIAGYFSATGTGTNWAGYFAAGDLYIANGIRIITGAGASKVLTSDANGWATWVTPSVVSPGGSDTQVQFNDSGSFGGDSGLTYNKTTDILSGVSLDFSGHSAFGGAGVINKWHLTNDGNVVVSIMETITSFTNPVMATHSFLNLTAGANTSQSIYGADYYVHIADNFNYTGESWGIKGNITHGGTGTWGNNATGAFVGGVLGRVMTGTGGTIDVGIGVQGKIEADNGVINTAYPLFSRGTIGATGSVGVYGGVWIDAPVITAGGSITDTAVGLHIEDFSGLGAPNGNINIYSAGINSENYFEGSIFLGNDNSSLYFGAGDDASIYYNGTDLIINPQEVGSGHLIINSVKTTTGDPTGVEGKIYINTFDNVIKMYGDLGWRTLASW